MSVYNGFSTRGQENKYGKLSEMLVGLLSNKILRMLRGEKSDHMQFSKQLSAIYSKMAKLESIKYLHPKLSAGCNELAEYCLVNYEPCTSSSSVSLTETEVPPSPRVQKTFSAMSSQPLEQINEENIRVLKKKIAFTQERIPRPIQHNFESPEINANSYYEKVLDKYVKLSNKYAPRNDRSLSVGYKEPELMYKDGYFFKS